MPISIGCGSWTDSEYVGVLYPKGLPASARLSEYAKHFDHIEVNSTYHATPKLKHVQHWVKQTPKDFFFDIKMHRNLSQNPAHYEHLLSQAMNQLDPLFQAGKFGAFLLMLAPSFQPERHDLSELDGLLAALKPHPVAVEFRNRAWIEGKAAEETLEYLRKKKAGWVTVDMPLVDKPGVMPPLDELTSLTRQLSAMVQILPPAARTQTEMAFFSIYDSPQMEETRSAIHEADQLFKEVRAMLAPDAFKQLSDELSVGVVQRSQAAATEVAATTLQQSRQTALEVVDYAFNRALIIVLIVFALALILRFVWPHRLPVQPPK